VRLTGHQPRVTKYTICDGLRQLGVTSGDIVMMHCSLSSLGYVEGGADALIDAVLETVGDSGTVMMPTLPDIFLPFDPRTSPSTVGKVSEAFRLRSRALRSCHPSHAVAAIGARAAELTEGHEHTDPTGIDSPYDRLRLLRGWIVLLGVDHDRNTTLHLAESLADLPYLRRAELQVIQDDGKIRSVTVERMAYGHREFIGLDRALRSAGIQRIGRIGGAMVRLVRADELVRYGLNLLRRDPAAFLCKKPRCIFCLWARARIRGVQTGEPDDTDWQALSQRWGCADPRCEVCSV